MKYRRAMYYAVFMLPVTTLILIILFSARDMYEIRMTNPQDIYRTLNSYHSEPESFPLPESIYIYNNKKNVIYMFGESSLVMSDGETFPYYLQEKHDNIHVVNFGKGGISSSSIRQRVMEALEFSKPDIIVLYFGHNDYNNVYHSIIIPHYYNKFNIILRISHFISIKTKKPGVLQSPDYYSYSRITRPRLIKLFERLGFFNIRQEQFEPINNFILNNYISNASAIIDIASINKIPVVFITPIGNLRAEPFGDIDTTTYLYNIGLREVSYTKSKEYLKAARDKEIFTYDLRAKSPLVNYIRNLQNSNVYIMDLEKQLENRHFEFGYSNFLDYLHFNDSTHRIVADLIYDFMMSRNLLKVPE